MDPPRWNLKVVPKALAAATPTLRHVAAWTRMSYATVRAWRTGARTPTPNGRRLLVAMLRKQADNLSKLADRVEAEGAATRQDRNAQLELSEGFISEFM